MRIFAISSGDLIRTGIRFYFLNTDIRIVETQPNNNLKLKGVIHNQLNEIDRDTGSFHTIEPCKSDYTWPWLTWLHNNFNDRYIRRSPCDEIYYCFEIIIVDSM